ncbi:Crp/Fnr family transcriptional regulator [Salinactinospora qingdaonensis]|uniref:Crp/Fnr family transcriptional regulator n=1 Tax=Salinactinospora qingdaonensis TaxID=702744 RepID=A0ABP7G1S3_9ACTN
MTHRSPAPVPSAPWPSGSFMARLSEDARSDLLSLAPQREYPANTTLLHQGDTGGMIYILRSTRGGASACGKVVARLKNGDESLLDIRVSGDIVGELALLRKRQRMATVITCTATLVHAIPGADFRAFLSRHGEAWEAISSIIGDRLEWSEERRLDFTGYDVPARLARTVIALVERHGVTTPKGVELGVNLSQAELGRLIGAKEDAVGQAVRHLREAGWVQAGYRNLTVTDLSGLRTFSENGR